MKLVLNANFSSPDEQPANIQATNDSGVQPHRCLVAQRCSPAMFNYHAYEETTGILLIRAMVRFLFAKKTSHQIGQI